MCIILSVVSKSKCSICLGLAIWRWVRPSWPGGWGLAEPAAGEVQRRAWQLRGCSLCRWIRTVSYIMTKQTLFLCLVQNVTLNEFFVKTVPILLNTTSWFIFACYGRTFSLSRCLSLELLCWWRLLYWSVGWNMRMLCTSSDSECLQLHCSVPMWCSLCHQG